MSRDTPPILYDELSTSDIVPMARIRLLRSLGRRHAGMRLDKLSVVWTSTSHNLSFTLGMQSHLIATSHLKNWWDDIEIDASRDFDNGLGKFVDRIVANIEAVCDYAIAREMMER